MTPCSECGFVPVSEGLGLHHRWCPTTVGAHAARIGQMADDLDAVADSLPTGLGNPAWYLAAELHRFAAHLMRQEEGL